MSKPCDALFLSPHPDDADLFCGATAATWARAGWRVTLADLSRGERASNGTVEGRRRESEAAAEALGVQSERLVLGFPDGGIDAGDSGQLRELVELLRRTRPRVLVAPWREDRHPDHREASELARRAHFFAGVHGFETATAATERPRHLIYYPCHAQVDIDLVVDVSSAMESWERALACYHSQFERGEGSRPTKLNEPGFLGGLRARRRVWGELVGCPWAEAFRVEGPLLVGAETLFKAEDV